MKNKSKLIVISLVLLSFCLLSLVFFAKDNTNVLEKNLGDVNCIVTSGPNQVFGEAGAYHTVANCGRDFKKTGDCYEKGGTVDTSNCGPDDGNDCYTYRKYHVECSEDVKPTSCNPGHYLNSSGCHNCDDGKWSDGGNATTCYACPAGYYCKGGVKTKCTGNKYSASGKSSCMSCNGIIKKNSAGENVGCDYSSKESCTGNTYLENNECKDCSELTGDYYCTADHRKALCNGRAIENHTKCESLNIRCAINGVATGRYVSNGVCVDCPSPYKYSKDNNGDGINSCYAKVSAGEYLTFNGSFGYISTCPSGTYSEDNNSVYYGGSTRCISCSSLNDNYYCTADHRKALCLGSVNDDNTICNNECKTGQYWTNSGCKNCGDGEWSNGGSTTVCSSCPSGYACKNGIKSACTGKEYSSGGRSQCITCEGVVLKNDKGENIGCDNHPCTGETYLEDGECKKCSELTGNYYCTADHKKELCNGRAIENHTKCESSNKRCALNGVTTGLYVSNGVCVDCPSPYKYSKDNNGDGISSCYAKVSAGEYLTFNGSFGYIMTCPSGTYSEDNNSVYYGESTRCISCSTLDNNYYCNADHKKELCNYTVNKNNTKCINCPDGTILDDNDNCVRSGNSSGESNSNFICPDLYVGSTGVCTLSNGTITSGSVNSSNPNAIEILGNNTTTINIGGKAVGSSIISGRATNGNNFSATSNVRKNEANDVIKTIKIDGPNSITIKSSNEMRIYKAIVTPVTYNDQIIWSTSDSSIATISSNGTLTALKAGTVTISARSNANSSISDSLNVTITNENCIVTINNVSNSSTIPVNDKVKVSFKVTGSNCNTTVETKLSNFTGPGSATSLDIVEFKPIDSCKVGTIKGCITGSNICSNTISVKIKCNSTGSGKSGSSDAKPPEETIEPVLQQYCYANAVTLKEATLATLLSSPVSPYMHLIVDENNSLITDANKCVASACYLDLSTKDYKWATIGSLPSSYIKQEDILVEDRCRKKDSCMVLITKDNVDYKWITTIDEYNNLIKEGYTEVNANQSSCKAEAKCYNRNNDYVWSFVQPDGYTVIDLPSEECVPVVVEEKACYAHKQYNGTYEYRWETDKGGILTAHDKEHCKSNVACYKYKDGKNYIGDYSLNSDYTILDNDSCVINSGNVNNKNDASGKNKLIFIILIILLISLIIYYFYRNSRNNKR